MRRHVEGYRSIAFLVAHGHTTQFTQRLCRDFSGSLALELCKFGLREASILLNHWHLGQRHATSCHADLLTFCDGLLPQLTTHQQWQQINSKKLWCPQRDIVSLLCRNLTFLFRLLIARVCHMRRTTSATRCARFALRESSSLCSCSSQSSFRRVVHELKVPASKSRFRRSQFWRVAQTEFSHLTFGSFVDGALVRSTEVLDKVAEGDLAHRALLPIHFLHYHSCSFTTFSYTPYAFLAGRAHPDG